MEGTGTAPISGRTCVSLITSFFGQGARRRRGADNEPTHPTPTSTPSSHSSLSPNQPFEHTTAWSNPFKAMEDQDDARTLDSTLDDENRHGIQQRLTPSWRLALLSFVPICLVIFAQRPWSPTTSMKVIDVAMRNATHIIHTSADPASTTSHFSPFVMHGKIPYDERPLLPPLEMLETYIARHSQASLWNDWRANNMQHRKFAIVHYSCPQQLGNRLHHFYNDFLLAFLTNRTSAPSPELSTKSIVDKSRMIWVGPSSMYFVRTFRKVGSEKASSSPVRRNI